MLQNDINITAICVGKNILPKFNTAIILKPFRRSQETLLTRASGKFPNDRLILLERRRATLSRQCKYKTSKCSEFNQHLAKDKEKLLFKICTMECTHVGHHVCICIIVELLDCGLNEII